MPIQKTAVIGAGSMGSRIAAHMANAGAEVVLLDIVPKGEEDRNKLAKEALEKLKQDGTAFTHLKHAEQITLGNLEDDLDKLAEVDWIVEAIVEKLDIKQDLYRKLDKARREGSFVSSNTSTLPLKQLHEGMSKAFKTDFCITHFFNPPRQMRLVELIASGRTSEQRLSELTGFIEDKLGKTVVPANDLPGFIANRIGIFWMLLGLQQAIEQNISPELADGLLGKPLGFPKTGIFGLMDLVGIDLMVDIGTSLQERLPKNDWYQQLDDAMALLTQMKDQNRLGKKGNGGFYRKADKGKQVLDLQSGEYRAFQAPDDPILKTAKDKGLAALFDTDSGGAAYGRSVMTRLLRYAISMLPEVADTLLDIDQAMKLGFNWQQGPFEMIDTLGAGRFCQILDEGECLPDSLLRCAADKEGFYKEDDQHRYYLDACDRYKPVEVRPERWQLADQVRGQKPLIENEAARLWDIGDGIANLELTTKMDVMDHATFDLIEQAINKVKADFKGMIVGDDDQHFSAGLNLHTVLDWCEAEDWEAIEGILKRGQQTMLALKYAPFPVVGAPSGLAIGGACEMLLHADCIQAHCDARIGLVEVHIGVVPSWGGCKELLAKHLVHAHDPNSQLEAIENVFRLIADAKPAGSAEQARDWHILRGCCGITMHRDQLLADAKARCLKAAEHYTPPKAVTFPIPRGAAKQVLEEELKRRELKGHDRHVLECLALVLSGGGLTPKPLQQTELAALEDRTNDDAVPTTLSEDDLLTLERRAFMALIQTNTTQQNINDAL